MRYPIRYFAFLALAANVMAGVRFDIVPIMGYPLVPTFYERPNSRFSSLGLSIPVLRRLDVQAGIAWSYDHWDGPYNDVSNTNGKSTLLNLGAEWEAFRGGPVRLFVASGLFYIGSRWEADDYAYEDPDEPREYWTGRFSSYGLHADPGIELFREDQAKDWSLALSVPFYQAVSRSLDDKSSAVEARFFDSYMDDESGWGVKLSVRFGLK